MPSENIQTSNATRTNKSARTNQRKSSRDTMSLGTTVNQNKDSSSAEVTAVCQSRQPEDESTNATDIILVAVLRVFAARGRAIREEQAKREIARPGSVPGEQESSATK